MLHSICNCSQTTRVKSLCLQLRLEEVLNGQCAEGLVPRLRNSYIRFYRSIFFHFLVLYFPAIYKVSISLYQNFQSLSNYMGFPMVVRPPRVESQLVPSKSAIIHPTYIRFLFLLSCHHRDPNSWIVPHFLLLKTTTTTKTPVHFLRSFYNLSLSSCSS